MQSERLPILGVMVPCRSPTQYIGSFSAPEAAYHHRAVLSVPGLPIDVFSRARIDASVNELKEEKSMVSELLAGL